MEMPFGSKKLTAGHLSGVDDVQVDVEDAPIASVREQLSGPSPAVCGSSLSEFLRGDQRDLGLFHRPLLQSVQGPAPEVYHRFLREERPPPLFGFS